MYSVGKEWQGVESRSEFLERGRGWVGGLRRRVPELLLTISRWRCGWWWEGREIGLGRKSKLCSLGLCTV